jgi:hypothetical protein
MNRGIARIAAVLVLMAGCGSHMSTPSGPSSSIVTDTFSGTVAQGATSFGENNRNHFTVRSAGDITATLIKLAPTDTLSMGLGIGLFSSATSTCVLDVVSAVKLNVSLIRAAQGPGEFCVGVYDVGGVQQTPFDYSVSVIHP